MKIWDFDHSKKCIKCQAHDLKKTLNTIDADVELLDVHCQRCQGKYKTHTWEHDHGEDQPSKPGKSNGKVSR